MLSVSPTSISIVVLEIGYHSQVLQSSSAEGPPPSTVILKVYIVVASAFAFK